MPDDERISERLARIEKGLDGLQSRLVGLEGVIRDVTAPRMATGETSGAEAVLKSRIAALEAEKLTLHERVKILTEGRLQARPELITEGFRKALDALQTGLAPKPGDRSTYTVSEMQVELKSLIALDEEGGLRFVLPAPDERFEPAQLSEVKFTLRASGETAAAVDLVAVPSLLGLPQAAAQAALARVGLRPGEVTEQESRYVPGTVVGQSPDPGDEVAPEVPIAFVVAVAIKPTVPDLRGFPVDEAIGRIEALGLTVGRLTRREAKDVEEGTVLTQEPLAGIRVDPGTAVSLVLAIASPPTVTLPDLVRLPRGEAEARLKALGLTVGEVSQEEDGRPGLVLAQTPKAGTEVPPGSPVSLAVSSEIAVEVLIARAVKAAAGTRAGISGRLLGERLRALDLKDYAAFEALAAAPLEELQRSIGAPTPRGLQDAQAALRKALMSESE